ncbi:MAG: LacI family DNA-binding transcriptional regulator [Fimbriimonadaceae bacterium]|nr:LacI family DNA-binding transcriptional regulator [Fimbriimonadaceae bacterium]
MSRPGDSGKRSPSTLRQIAEEAGVSISAVSKVLNGGGKSVRVSPATADHIRSVAQRLNYVPNVLAQSLRTARSRTVGLVFENFGSIADGPEFYVQLLDGLASEVFKRHYRLTILPEIDRANPMRSIGDGRMDGVVWCKMPPEMTTIDKLRHSPVPFVALHAPPPEAPTGTVFISCDNSGGARLAVDHLVSLGHRRLLFVLERHEETTPDAQARLSGFLEACTSHGIDVHDEDVVIWGREAEEFGHWLRRRYGQTAVFAWNEQVASSILRRAAEHKVSVPGDLSVVGFDSTRYCELTTPRLTAVRQPIRLMASQAAHTLLDLIEGRKPSQYDQVFACTLDVRDSTGPCRPNSHS